MYRPGRTAPPLSQGGLVFKQLTGVALAAALLVPASGRADPAGTDPTDIAITP
jgi:hypothetical protein